MVVTGWRPGQSCCRKPGFVWTTSAILMRRCYQSNLSHCNVTVQLLAAEETDASFGRRWRPKTELKEWNPKRRLLRWSSTKLFVAFLTSTLSNFSNRLHSFVFLFHLYVCWLTDPERLTAALRKPDNSPESPGTSLEQKLICRWNKIIKGSKNWSDLKGTESVCIRTHFPVWVFRSLKPPLKVLWTLHVYSGRFQTHHVTKISKIQFKFKVWARLKLIPWECRGCNCLGFL